MGLGRLRRRISGSGIEPLTRKNNWRLIPGGVVDAFSLFFQAQHDFIQSPFDHSRGSQRHQHPLSNDTQEVPQLVIAKVNIPPFRRSTVRVLQWFKIATKRNFGRFHLEFGVKSGGSQVCYRFETLATNHPFAVLQVVAQQIFGQLRSNLA